MFRKGSRLHRHFAKWVKDEKGNVGQYAHVFNAPRDSLSSLMDQFLVGINMNEALESGAWTADCGAHLRRPCAFGGSRRERLCGLCR